MPNTLIHRLFPLLLLLFTTAQKAQAQEPSPRDTIRQFVSLASGERWNEAIRLIEWPAKTPDKDKIPRAKLLFQLLDESSQLELAQLSDEPQGLSHDHIDPNIEVVGTITTKDEPYPIKLKRSEVNGQKIWRFSPRLANQIDSLAKRTRSSSLVSLMPPWARSPVVLTLEPWQWLGIGAILVLGLIIGPLISLLLRPLTTRGLKRLDWGDPQEILAQLAFPAKLILGLFWVSIALEFLKLPLTAREWLGYGETIVYGLGFATLGFRLTRIAIKRMTLKFQALERSSALAMLPPISRGLHGVIGVSAVLYVCHGLGFNITAILAGLGVGGLAIALAGQKTIENLFGGISVILDQPVRVGDFCRFGDKTGTVEDIGLRSTKIRSLDRTVIAVPNADFAHIQLENFSKRDKIRYCKTLGLRYETTPDQMRLVLLELKELLVSHPMVADDPARVRFVDFGAYSLDIEIFCYILTSDYNEFLMVAEDLNLRIMDIVSQCGCDFAFPSHTTYLEKSEGVSDATIRSAEARYAEIKTKGGAEFPFPAYPETWQTRHRNTLAFPPVPD